MSQRNSGYARMPHDTYVTPRWVYEALYSVEPWARTAWDCAPVDADFDFLAPDFRATGWIPTRDIATNPPFAKAAEFCRLAVNRAPRVAMLMPISFDAAKGRGDMFKHPAFKAKYTLTTRIRWENLEQKKSGPSQNHAWYVWDCNHNGPAVMGWL